MVVDQVSDVEVDRLFRALADATRRDIVRRVLVAEESVSGLARHYPMSVTAVQKHVAVLEEAGLVARRREGRELRLSGRPEALRRAQDLLDAFEQVWRGRLERMADVLAADVAPVRSDPRQAAQPASAKPPSAPARPAPRSTRASRRDTP